MSLTIGKTETAKCIQVILPKCIALIIEGYIFPICRTQEHTAKAGHYELYQRSLSWSRDYGLYWAVHLSEQHFVHLAIMMGACLLQALKIACNFNDSDAAKILIILGAPICVECFEPIFIEDCDAHYSWCHEAKGRLPSDAMDWIVEQPKNTPLINWRHLHTTRHNYQHLSLQSQMSRLSIIYSK